ncbi:MAG TPA: hypothetical protein VLU43_12675 [Anaeromyxobacteraceae bacterium]|nr:hypothetical protein [Anaeromyxobacteraceae bacterium]
MFDPKWSAAVAVSAALGLAGCQRPHPEVHTITLPPVALAAAESVPPPGAGGGQPTRGDAGPAPESTAAAADAPTPEDVARFNQRVPK